MELQRRLGLAGSPVRATAGALPTLYAAVMDLPDASYVGPDGLGGWRGTPTLVGRSPNAADPDSARRLWAVSEELTGTAFPGHLRPTPSSAR